MSVPRATRIGAYEIGALLGAGAMGEVYVARDTTLDRDVAVKVLPDAFARDPDRLARFEREARLLASLNHPHIATVYGLERSGGHIALIMELVEGLTLADVIQSRLAGHGLPVTQAIRVARQIAEALDAAHEHGIIHRDLKPANIKVTDDGEVKVLDFGLAKAVNPPDVLSGAVAASPTITSPVSTQMGVVLGTPAYMSPEQARGKTIDKRSDIWAFGCVVFEMLAGRPPFGGDSVTDVLAGIVQGEPAWQALPASVPPHIVQLLRRCLEKDRKQRLRDIGDAIVELSADVRSAPLPAVARRKHVMMERVVWLVALAFAAAAGWLLHRPPANSRPIVRFTIAPPEGVTLNPPDGTRRVVVAPDGRSIVYTAGGQLYRRGLDDDESHPIDGSKQEPILPAFSPDGNFIVYAAPDAGTGRYILKKIAATGGPPLTLPVSEAPRSFSQLLSREFGVVWSGTQLMSPDADGIFAFPDGGGTRRRLVGVNAGTEIASWPQLFANGRHVLFTLRRLDKSGDEATSIIIQKADGSERRVLVEAGAFGRVVPSGHLVYSSGTKLMAVPFDESRLVVTGTAVEVEGDVARGWDVSTTGTLAYERLPQGGEAATLVWVDRQGREEAIETQGLPAGSNVRLSPDRTRIAVSAGSDVWIWTFAKQLATRLTLTAEASEFNPIWSHDGRHVIFDSGPREASAARQIFVTPADGSGSPVLLGENPAGWPDAVSPDGKHLIFHTMGMLPTLMLQPMAPRSPARQLLNVRSLNLDFSPDGRWIAYQAYEAGRWDVYVQPFPAVDSGRWQVSTGGGRTPLWAPDGRELFYLTDSNTLMAVPIEPGPSFVMGKPAKVLTTADYATTNARNYDVSSDGRRFLFVKRRAARPGIVVVTNWFDEVRRKVAAGPAVRSR